MAKRRGSRPSKATPLERGPPLRSLTLRLLPELTTLQPLQPVEDRRTYHPLQYHRPAKRVSGQPVDAVRVSQKPRARARARVLPSQLQFPDPHRVVICVRRKQRREVLFAKRRTGRGAAARRRRRNWYSTIGC